MRSRRRRLDEDCRTEGRDQTRLTHTSRVPRRPRGRARWRVRGTLWVILEQSEEAMSARYNEK
jgi:hypothetical protein